MVNFYHFRLSRLLASWCIAATIISWVSTVRAIDFPATLDVDIVYPRNGTFAPTLLTPIVFTIRNPQLAAPLDLNLDWAIYRNDRPVGDGPWSDGTKRLIWATNPNATDPFFVYAYTYKLNVETSWWLRWELSWGNCSQSETNHPNFSFNRKVNVVEFTTKNGSTQFDLATVNRPGDDTCGNVTDTRVSFNVTGVLDTRDAYKYDDIDTCAVLAPPSNITAPPPTRTCGPEIDASAASSISAAITATACAWFPDPELSCPPEKPSSAVRGIGGPFLAGTATWLKVFMSASVAYILVA
ncbi:uncharacterized protein F4812DRAFT_417712 [Daldinia caldariorum]|uniref:uncharacterized protein n=1 Tax=Daldinia caldariorum TaxID=326644 RepID=UPI0020074F48|nr:uncharacterized protein F4812DRAFT_417712 [Daldinia caldariorum]KAI1470471.1 hypothetical protein F4812DRAFT_417712 [Daldinia caldariorum]